MQKSTGKQMVKYQKKVSFFTVYETWFNYQPHFWNIFSLNAFMHLKNAGDTKIFAVQENSHTLELNLEQSPDVLSSNFSKQIRQQVRIAENEGTVCYFHNEIELFAEFFNDFAQKKKTFNTSTARLRELGNSVQFSFAKNNGQVLAAHSYLVDPEIGIVRHLHSATKRLDENVDRNLVGRANKYLTVKDIFHFKEMGYKVFDFGGYAKDTTDESLKGINNYKLLFGGTVVTCRNYYSYGYWLMKKMSKLLGLSGRL